MKILSTIYDTQCCDGKRGRVASLGVYEDEPGNAHWPCRMVGRVTDGQTISYVEQDGELSAREA